MEKILNITPELCNGCRLCELVCALYKEGLHKPSLSRIRIIRIYDKAVDMPTVCLHCENAICIDVCPIGAMKRNGETGAITLDAELCVGCRACMLVCPYGAISLDPQRRIVFKCDLCEGDPKCVKYCPTKAIDFVVADKSVMDKRRIMTEKITRLTGMRG